MEKYTFSVIEFFTKMFQVASKQDTFLNNFFTFYTFKLGMFISVIFPNR